MAYIDNFPPRTGRIIKEDNTIVNEADGVNADGSKNVQLTGSTVAAVPTTQAQKDIAMYAYENIINEIGLENIKLLLPMWETSGTEFTDLINPNLKFIAEGVTLAQPGMLHSVPSFDGVNDYVRQKPLTENNVGTAEYALTDGTWKAAQKIKPYALAGSVKFFMLWLKKVGSPAANLVVKLVEDNAGQPTGAVVATSETWAASNLVTAPEGMIGLYLASPFYADRSKLYWLVFEYSSPTTINTTNYVSFFYDTAGGYGQPRATYNGTTWTVQTGQSHVFAVYSDDLTLDQDYTILCAAQPTALWGTLITPCIGKIAFDSGSLRYGTSSNDHNDLKVYSMETGIATTFSYIPVLPLLFEVFAYSFSYALSTFKVNLYHNTKLLASANGTATTGANPPQQPFIVGTTRNNDFAYYIFFKGKMGPIIVTKNILTQAQLGKIQNQLLALRRLGEAV